MKRGRGSRLNRERISTLIGIIKRLLKENGAMTQNTLYSKLKEEKALPILQTTTIGYLLQAMAYYGDIEVEQQGAIQLVKPKS